MILFGLFHGLVFLPSVLSVMGPEAYQHVKEEEGKGREEEETGPELEMQRLKEREEA